jgi:hypothetical protein
MEHQANKSTRQTLGEVIQRLQIALDDAKSIDENTPRTQVQAITTELANLLYALKPYCFELKESPFAEGHKRLIGTGIGYNSFTSIAYRDAVARPAHIPPFLDMKKFKEAIDEVHFKQAMLSQVTALSLSLSSSLRVDSDIAYHCALEYYNSLKAAAKNNIIDAKSEYNYLKTFFKRTKRKTRVGQPTEKQLKKDVKSLLKGTKEGTIVIKNENPTTSGGKRTITDTAHTDHSIHHTIQNSESTD